MKTKIGFLVLCILFFSIVPQAFSLTGPEILKASDDKLLPPSCSYRLNLVTKESDGSKKKNTFDGFKKGNAKNIMLVTKPTKVAGSVHMRNELVIWSYYVTDKKLVQEAYASVFMGSLLNYGDVMATELSYDYNVIDTKEKDAKQIYDAKTAKKRKGTKYVLTLKPKPGHDGYAKVVVIVDQNDLIPERREYYALSGELMKTCDIEELKRKKSRGKELTTKMEQKYYEPMKDRDSIATYDKIEYLEEKDIPESYFNENQIKYLGGD